LAILRPHTATPCGPDCKLSPSVALSETHAPIWFPPTHKHTHWWTKNWVVTELHKHAGSAVIITMKHNKTIE
jgi:hypothetical protein